MTEQTTRRFIGDDDVRAVQERVTEQRYWTDKDEEIISRLVVPIEQLHENVASVIRGQDDAIDMLILTFLVGGHALVEGVPGVAKTEKMKAFMRSIAGTTVGRFQGTPDMVPRDITGYFAKRKFIDENGVLKEEWAFNETALYHPLVLFDEINRTPPKARAALLQAMQEGYTTVDDVRHDLPRPFVLLATQNPIEFSGTYPLGEQQADRFAVKYTMTYPDKASELLMMEEREWGDPASRLKPVVHIDDLLVLSEAVRAVQINDANRGLVRRAINRTRELAGSTGGAEVLLGASPRASLWLQATAKAKAFRDGRYVVEREDIREMFPYVAHHRLRLGDKFKSRIKREGTSEGDALAEFTEKVFMHS